MNRSQSADQAVQLIRSHSRVFIHSVAAAPQALIRSMTARAPELENVEVVHLHTEGPAPYADPGMEKSFRVHALFVGKNIRQAVNEGRADYIPVFLSDVPALFRQRVLPLDVALVQVSPPDKHGFCSLGTSVDASKAAVESATTVIAQVNRYVPRTHGDSQVHISRFAAIVEHDEPLPEAHACEISEREALIGKFVSELVEDGATLQMGIGGIPNAVLASLHGHRDLGIHTEMFSDGLIDLVEKGVVTGKYKKVHPGKIITGFCYGTQRLYDFVDDNPQIAFMDIGFVNDTSVIRKNPKVTAVNSAIEVDITGQVSADTIGTRQYSGVGGQMDFMRGAALSEGGRPIIALPSTTKRGESRIVATLKPGANVVTTRAHVRFIVTEYGIADLQAKSLQERAKALIGIAHPDHREELARAAAQRFGAA